VLETIKQGLVEPMQKINKYKEEYYLSYAVCTCIARWCLPWKGWRKSRGLL